MDVNAKINLREQSIYTNIQLVNSLTLMSLAFCKTQIPLRVPEEIKRVFKPRELSRFQPSVMKSLTSDSPSLSGCLVTRRKPNKCAHSGNNDACLALVPIFA